MATISDCHFYDSNEQHTSKTRMVSSSLKVDFQIGLDASKIMILTLKINNTLAHLKSLKTKNWKHYFMKTHARQKLNLQNH